MKQWEGNLRLGLLLGDSRSAALALHCGQFAFLAYSAAENLSGCAHSSLQSSLALAEETSASSSSAVSGHMTMSDIA